METPNPECLANFATHFYLDPTHRRPVPPILAAFHMEEAGLGRIEIKRLCQSLGGAELLDHEVRPPREMPPNRAPVSQEVTHQQKKHVSA